MIFISFQRCISEDCAAQLPDFINASAPTHLNLSCTIKTLSNPGNSTFNDSRRAGYESNASVSTYNPGTDSSAYGAYPGSGLSSMMHSGSNTGANTPMSLQAEVRIFVVVVFVFFFAVFGIFVVSSLAFPSISRSYYVDSLCE